MSHPAPRRIQKPDYLTSSRRQWLLAAISAVFILVLLAVVLSKPATAYVPEIVGAPHLVIEQTEFDYGSVQYGTTVETKVVVRNTGDQPLVLTEPPHVQVVEGCCPPQAEVDAYALRPGQETTVTVRFTMHEGMGGPHDFRLHITTNDPDQPVQTVVIRSNWVA